MCPFSFTTFFCFCAARICLGFSSCNVIGVSLVTRTVGRHKGYASFVLELEGLPHGALDMAALIFTHFSRNHLFSPVDGGGGASSYVPPRFLYSRTIHADLYALVFAKNNASASRLTDAYSFAFDGFIRPNKCKHFKNNHEL